jgi:acyl transferase domain-containing protein/SAM-dependent methyltransferase/acyl carrier protein
MSSDGILLGIDMAEDVDSVQAIDPVAIIGMACRFPGAADTESFWRNLCAGTESIRLLTDAELIAAGVDSTLLNDPQYVKAAATLDGIDRFDAAFFGFAAHEADVTDPQHRLFLECAWEALERAGYAGPARPERIGVFAGCGMNAYLLHHAAAFRAAMQTVGDFPIAIGNDKDFLATRTAYKFDLHGPAFTVNTACSTSLVAVQLACQSLLTYQSDMVLAGAASVQIPHGVGYRYQEGGIVSADGHCRAFDAEAGGTVGGSGAGAVVLKRLSDALADGDHIHAVIRAAAINNDGAGKVGFTAPSVAGQAEVIRAAQELAGIRPDSIGYVEAHGTATALGDPIEIAALTEVFDRGAGPGTCLIGSVKTNLGHLDTVAGLAGLIKTVLALEQGRIPPSLHFTRPNPRIDFAAGPFRVATALSDWPARPTPRRAGVSSFGIGGTNAHVVLEEAPPRPAAPAPAVPSWQVLPLSARTPEALAEAARRLADHLEGRPGLSLADVAFTLQVGRKPFERRRSIVARTVSEAVAALRAPDDGTRLGEKLPAVAFLFPGQGAQRPGMAAGLYAAAPVFRAELDRCCALATPLLGTDLRALLIDAGAPAGAERLRDTALAQPALFAFSYALARQWQAWGVQPDALIGHSLGEYVAACLAGVFDLESAVALVVQRGRLMQALPPGAMLAVPLGAEQAGELIGGTVALAVVNGPNQIVLSGPVAAIEAVQATLAARGVGAQRLETSHAFHSAMMEPILGDFAAAVAAARPQAPRLPVVSNLTGTWLTAAEATDPAYWVAHLRQTVRFGDGLAVLLAQDGRVLLEVGPGRTLAGLVRRHPGRRASQEMLANDGADAVQGVLQTLGRLWQAGIAVDWPALHGGAQRCRVPLPTYAFDRRRHWIAAEPATEAAQVPAAVPAGAGRKAAPRLTDRFTLPTWRRSVLPAAAPAGGRWLLFLDRCGLGAALAECLRASGGEPVIVEAGTAFEKCADDRYILDPARPDGYDRLFRDLADRMPDGIVHLWSVTGGAPTAPERVLDLGFNSLVQIAKMLGKRLVTEPLQIAVVSDGMQDVSGDEALEPVKATLCGPVAVIPLEYLSLGSRSIDIVLPADAAGRRPELLRRLADRLAAELAAPAADRFIAYRGAHRLVRTLTPVELPPAPAGGMPRLRDRATCLITGGLGGVGLELAAWLAQRARARLVLTGRSEFPPRESWDALLARAKAETVAKAGQADGITLDLSGETDRFERLFHSIEAELGIRTLDQYDGLQARIEELCACLLVDYLRGQGIDLTQPHKRADLIARLRIIPSFEKLFNIMLEALVEDGIADLSADGVLRFLRTDLPDPAVVRHRLAADYPGFAPMLGLLDHCVHHYSQALTGEIPAVSVLFPDGGEGLMLESARNTVEFINNRVIRVLAREVVSRVLEAAPGRRLRILEIGGGNGYVTGVIAPALKGADVKYHFTDIGKSFVLAAERKAAKFGFDFMTFGTLDVSADLAAQGYEDDSFDLVIALDVIHATPDIRASVRNIQRLLRPGGALLLLESVKSYRWDHMIAGLAEGWWFGQDNLRTNSPLLDIPTWERVLGGLKFAGVTSYPRSEAQRRLTDSALFVAQMPGQATSAGAGEQLQRTAERIRRLRAMEAAGAEILIARADVADAEAMAAVVATAEQRFGPITGVIHSAMDMRSGTIQLKDAEAVRAEFAPKLAGTLVLDRLFRDRPLDFLVLCSSASALSGGFADVGYCAANNFIDAFAHLAARDRFAVSINWDRWRGVGFAADYERWHERTTGRSLQGGMSAAEAVEAFERILASDTPAQIAVSTAARPAPAPSAVPATVPEAGGSHDRPALATPFAAPVGATESEVATIWAAVLGLSQVGRDDHFTELGGDSLIAIQISSRLREHFRLDIAVRTLFEAPTVVRLADHIDTLRWAAGSAALPDAMAGVEKEEGAL